MATATRTPNTRTHSENKRVVVAEHPGRITPPPSAVAAPSSEPAPETEPATPKPKTTRPASRTKNKFEVHAEQLATAVALAKSREAEHAAAETALAEMHAALAHGDESISAEELATAIAAVQRAELLSQHASAAVESLTAAAPVRPIIAEALAPVLSESLRLPVIVTDEMPADLELSPDTLPVAYLVQAHHADVAKRAPVGAVRGSVRLTIVRGKQHATLTPEQVREALKGVQGWFFVTDGGSGPRGSVVIESVTVAADWCYPLLPVMPDPANSPYALGNEVARLIADGSLVTTPNGAPEMERVGPNGAPVPAQALDTDCLRARVTHSATDDDGLTVTVEADVSVEHRKAYADYSSVAHLADTESRLRQVEETVSSLVGSVVGALGRVRSAEVAGWSTGERNGRPVAVAHIRAEITSGTVL